LTHPGKPFKVVRLNAMEGNEEMLTVETIRKIKLAHGRDEKSIGQIARDFNLSRDTVRKVLRSDATKFE
jgi:DNA-binding CsgD family transcriptional regulator